MVQNYVVVPKLESLNESERKTLIIKFLTDQIIEERKRLHFWRSLTNQPAQIDTGYMAQHLVSLVTGIKGGGFRGKGDDLADGSEVKSANFLDSYDAKGAIAPRWNFQCNDIQQMLSLLDYPAIYLTSIDFSPTNNIRFRVWKLNPRIHKEFNLRYSEWMKVLGYPKLSSPERPGVNFQLFPPRNKTNDNYARHGNDRTNGFSKLKIHLENIEGSVKLFEAEVNDNKLEIKLLYSNSAL